VASRYTPLNNGFFVKIISRPSIPDNIMNWRVFNNITQIINFLTSLDVFQDYVIDDKIHQQDLQNFQDEASKVKANFIPNNVLTLKNLFDLQTKLKRPANPNTNVQP
jgi:hypothetical protein